MFSLSRSRLGGLPVIHGLTANAYDPDLSCTPPGIKNKLQESPRLPPQKNLLGLLLIRWIWKKIRQI